MKIQFEQWKYTKNGKKKKNGDGKTFTMQYNVMLSKYITDLKLCTLMTSFWIHKNPNKYLRLSFLYPIPEIINEQFLFWSED